MTLKTPPIQNNSSQGFTLIELMIVVALVGILASLGVANLRKFQAKARQAEAKVNLGAMATAEQIFFGEKGSYTLCLSDTGYDGPMGGKQYYRKGFTWNIPVQDLCGPAGTGSCKGYAWGAGGVAVSICPFGSPIGLNKQVWPSNASISGTSCDIHPPTAATVPNASTFLLGASGAVSKDPICDRWTIDQNRRLLNIQPGL